MTDDDIYALWLYCNERWPHSFEIPEGERHAVKLAVWHDDFDDLSPMTVRAAIARLGCREFAPTTGMIRIEADLLISDLSGCPRPLAPDQALVELGVAISKLGRSEKPLWSDPVIGEAVSAMGGWRNVCDSELTPAWRAQFRDAFLAAQERAKQAAKRPTPVERRLQEQHETKALAR